MVFFFYLGSCCSFEHINEKHTKEQEKWLDVESTGDDLRGVIEGDGEAVVADAQIGHGVVVVADAQIGRNGHGCRGCSDRAPPSPPPTTTATAVANKG